MKGSGWLEDTKNNDFYRCLFESVRDPIIIIRADGLIIDANKSLVVALGYSKEELLRMNVADLRPPAEYRKAREHLEKSYQGYSFETSYIRKDGSILPVEINAKGAMFGNEKVLFAVIRDITERRRAHEAPWESEEKFRVLTDTAPAAICILQDGRLRYVNNATETITGYDRNELQSKDFLDMISPGFQGYVRGLYTDWLMGRIRRARFETMIIRKDAGERWIDVSVSTIGYLGKPGLILTATDISDRKRLEKLTADRATELSHALETLETTINTMQVGVVVAEAGTEKILYHSPRAEEIIGVPMSGSATGRPPDKPTGITMLNPDGSAIPPDEWPLASALRRGETTVNEEIVIRQANGREITTLINCTPIRDAGGQIINAVASIVDITGRKQAEESLKEANQQTELYIDLMGHDINNLNHLAMGYLELALEQMDSKNGRMPDDRRLIERPMQALASSSALIENVRKLQKLMAEGVKVMPTDLDGIFRELETTNFHSQERDIRIIIPHVPGSTVSANELLKDVFVNLISNAVKHSDAKKPLTVEVKAETFDESGRRNYRCMVEDNGPGIPDELKSRLFNRFQRGTTGTHGKGLGLYLVRTLVEGYHGKVCVEDRVPGDHTKGAKFVIVLNAA